MIPFILIIALEWLPPEPITIPRPMQVEECEE